MKKLLLTVAVLGTVLLSACEKDELAVPSEKSLIKTEKGVACRGCGDWDITEPQP
ncbi:MAG: hypothetical protein Q8S11_15655 [Daejeonella sp.]|uniref:hypothetical protein n=1 Tax=Daejeonella sp. TaxID=2805397 RepID=UPI002736CA41|nr:hypothetical protein [Daejeonella sp.]MDP3469776.1 hypothetical protein [Daejeonella sp.]